ncbi:MAG: hypothetical protein P8X90_35955 [Desulfobacterales bacterium]
MATKLPFVNQYINNRQLTNLNRKIERTSPLSTKAEGKTVTRYIRKGLVPKVKVMTERHKKVRVLIQKLSTVNWELLKLESKK